METLTRIISSAGLHGRVLNEHQLARLVEGTPQRRYNLVNRALRSGELVRLRRGLYLVAADVSGSWPHPFVVAESLSPGAYVSLFSALSYHGWVPESVPVTQCITPHVRRSEVSSAEMGEFRFYPLAIRHGYFLEGVERLVLAGSPALVASPLRALLDDFCLRKREWTNIGQLTEDLRIEEAMLRSIDRLELERLRPVYKHRRMQRAIDGLSGEIGE
jgi:hypothetical protein